MVIVLVNGNPESSAVWSPLAAELEELGHADVRRLSPPGFGAPVPAGFTGTVRALHDWLVTELERIGGPVDLVGHDIGGGTSMWVAMSRPDLLRSWVNDTTGTFDPAYRWHDQAQEWQTLGLGEERVAEWMTAPFEVRVERVVGLTGADRDVAADIASAQTPEMGRAILAFYRSVVRPDVAGLGVRLEDAAARPGLALVAGQDHYVGAEDLHRRAAARAGARVEVLGDLGHWWMIQAPERMAGVLSGFWSSLG